MFDKTSEVHYIFCVILSMTECVVDVFVASSVD